MSMIDEVESVLLEQCQHVPFHNLFYLYDLRVEDTSLGGTCSDKVLQAKKVLTEKGVQCRLHTGLLEDKYDHRLLLVYMNQEVFYADIGSGWPSYRLFPLEGSESYQVCNITFSSKNENEYTNIWHRKDGKDSWVLRVPKKLRSEKGELDRVSRRYEMQRPFGKHVKFSQLFDDTFIFLNGLRVRIYCEGKPMQEIDLDGSNELITYIEDVFLFPIKRFPDVVKQLRVNCG